MVNCLKILYGKKFILWKFSWCVLVYVSVNAFTYVRECLREYICVSLRPCVRACECACVLRSFSCACVCTCVRVCS